MKIIDYLWGGVLILLGATLLGWISFNYLVEMQPSAEGKNPIIPTVLGVAFLVTGIWRLRRPRRQQ